VDSFHHKQRMDIAEKASRDSLDRKEKVGVLIANAQGICFTNYNRFPQGVEVTDERLEPPLKFLFTEHAERAAIFKAAKNGISLEGLLYTQLRVLALNAQEP
jgi:dCMP deaminase